MISSATVVKYFVVVNIGAYINIVVNIVVQRNQSNLLKKPLSVCLTFFHRVTKEGWKNGLTVLLKANNIV